MLSPPQLSTALLRDLVSRGNHPRATKGLCSSFLLVARVVYWFVRVNLDAPALLGCFLLVVSPWLWAKGSFPSCLFCWAIAQIAMSKAIDARLSFDDVFHGETIMI